MNDAADNPYEQDIPLNPPSKGDFISGAASAARDGAPREKILGVDHVQITIPKGMEAEGIAFYCGVLGLQQIEKPDALKPRGGFWLQAGDRQVHVGTEDGVDRCKTKAHVAYRVQNLDYWRAALPKHGIAIEEQVPIPGCKRFEFRDPFGNRVELTERL